MRARIGIVAALVLIPQLAAAQIVISEIMYDVSGTDTDREWVEVFNSGSASVHLTDWKFFEANTNHALATVQGGENLASGAYAVVADNPTKFLADNPGYSGLLFDSTFTLGNTGETLAVHAPSPDFTETDSVAYQGAWGAAGDGNTLQRQSVSAANFTAALPTPGTGSLVASSDTSSNSSSNTSSNTTTTQTDTTTQQSQTTPQSSQVSVSSYVAPPVPEIFVDAGDDRTLIVAADAEFDARAYDRKKQVLPNDHVRFLWNFGDGTTGEGPAVAHHFDYPGRYAVVVTIAEDKSAASNRFIVTAEPAHLAFGALPDGGVAIDNLAGRDLDLSGWIVKTFERMFVLPPNSILLAGQTMRISQKTLGVWSSPQTELDYPNGALAFNSGQKNIPSAPPAPAPVATPAPVPAQQTPPSVVVRSAPQAAPTETDVSTDSSGTEPIAATSSQVAAAAVAPGLLGGSAKWLLAVLALAAAAGLAVSLARRYGKGEWDIIEET